MKKYKTICLGLFASVMLSTSCNQNNSEKETKTKTVATANVEISSLLARTGEVGSVYEANKMFNTFQSLKDEISKNPKDYSARLKLADLYIVEARATGNYGYYYPAAVKMIDAVLAENPEKSEDKFRALTSKAVIQLSYHQFEDALATGQKAVIINPYNSRVYGILTDANLELGNYDEAVTMVDSMVAIRPDLRSYSRVSYLREIYGDVPGAIAALEMAIKAGAPGHEETAWCRVILGNLYKTYGNLEAAEFQFKASLAERKGYPFALQGLAAVESAKGNNKEAIQLLEQALEGRSDASFYSDLYHNYKALGNTQKMEEAKVKAFVELSSLEDDGHDHGHIETKEHGHSHDVGLEMAQLYLTLSKNYEEATHHGLHEYAIRPNNIDVNKVLAEAYLQADKLDLASEHFAKASATGSQNPQLILIGAMIELKKGNAKKGKEQIKKAWELNPYLNSNLSEEAAQVLTNTNGLAQN